jgi:hypothetical protein
MSLRKIALRIFVLGVIATTSIAPAKADLIDSMKHGFKQVIDFLTPYRGPKKNITTLVITSNYVKSKMLAELVQFETGQPFILLPAAGQDKIYFVPAHGKKPMLIPEEQLSRFIKFVNPKQILVLGDKTYVSAKYLNMIDENQTLVVITNKNWNLTAKSVQKLLNLNTLAEDYKHTYSEWISGQLYTPEKGQVPLKQFTDESIDDIEPIKLPEETKPVKNEVNTPKAETKKDKEVKEDKSNELVIEDDANLDEPQVIIPDDAPIVIDEK